MQTLRTTLVPAISLFLALTLGCGDDDAQTADSGVDAAMADVAMDSGGDAALDPDACNRCGAGCVDFSSDPMNCGACGNACGIVAGGAGSCIDGTCVLMCDVGVASCDGDPANGCESDLTSPTSCGACDVVCSAPANAQAMCDDATCGFACNEDYADCNDEDGCESLTTSDPEHCGGCDMACPSPANAAPACSEGTCAFICDDAFGDCNADASDGCEEPLDNVLHCGACGMTCPDQPRSRPVCEMGACGIECNEFWGNCDGDTSNGCERRLTEPANCGSCGNDCGDALCVEGACVSRPIVFVTSTTVVAGTLGGLAAADLICAQRATAAGLGGTFLAWMSTTTSSPSGRFSGTPFGWQRTDGTLVANNLVDLLDGILANPIDRDEFGMQVPPLSNICDVATGTNQDGSPRSGLMCDDWTGGSGLGGRTSSTSVRWTNDCRSSATCSQPRRIYCFEQAPRED